MIVKIRGNIWECEDLCVLLQQTIIMNIMDIRYNGWFNKDIYFGSSHSVFRDISVERSEILEVLEKSLWKDGL